MMEDATGEAAVAAHCGMLLGIGSPWRAKLEMSRRLVDIEVEYDSKKAVCCPHCGKECPGMIMRQSGVGAIWM